MIKRAALGLVALVFSILPMTEPARAQGISQKVGVCDPGYPARCVKPDANGATPVTMGAVPTGGATAAKQDTGNTSLAAIQSSVAGATPAGENHVGQIGGESFQLAPTITVQNAAYSAGNSEGGLITVTGAARTSGGKGTLLNLRLASVGGATNTVWVYAWSKLPTSTCTDKAAFVKANADNAYAVPGFPQSITLASPGSWDTTSYAQIAAINSTFKNQDSSLGTAIYLCFVTAGSVTPGTTTDLALVLNGYQE